MKRGDVVVFSSDEIFSEEDKIFCWKVDYSTSPLDIRGHFFEECSTKSGVYLGTWKKCDGEIWHEVLVEDEVYLFQYKQFIF